MDDLFHLISFIKKDISDPFLLLARSFDFSISLIDSKFIVSRVLFAAGFILTCYEL